MSPIRFFREMMVLGCTVLGTVIGYAAGNGLEPSAHMCLAFLGMGLGGAAAEFCLTR